MSGGRCPGRRHPLIGLVLCYVLGTWLGLRYSIPPCHLVAAGLVLWGGAVVAAVTRSDSLLSRVFVYLCVVPAAWAVCLIHPAVDRVNSGGALPGPGSEVEVRGVVWGDPDFRLLRDPGRSVWRFPVRLEAVRTAGGDWRPLRGRIRVAWFGRTGLRSPTYGERWTLNGRVEAPWGRKASTRQIAVTASDSQFLSAGHGRWFPSLCYRIRRQAAKRLSLGFEDSPESLALPRALLLGYREQLTWDRRQLFALTGTLHIFAISGLHVGIFAGILVSVLKWFRMPRSHWILVVAPGLAMYAMATGARASAVRACIMASVYFLAPFLGRKPDVPSGLALAALLILACSPAQLGDVGFLFSFTVVIGLIVLFPHFMRPMERIWQRDPMDIARDTSAQATIRDMVRYVVSLVALSGAAWLSSAPLTAYFFGRFTPIALLGNIAVIPLAFLSVLSGCLSLVLGSCVDFLAVIFNHANYALVSLLVLTMRAMAAIPFGSIRVSRPPLWTVALWYAVLIAGVLWLQRKQALSTESACLPVELGGEGKRSPFNTRTSQGFLADIDD